MAEENLIRSENELKRVERDNNDPHPTKHCFNLVYNPEIHGNAYDFKCSICYNWYLPEETLALTGCGHLFHHACFDDFTKEPNSKCPKCRHVINPTPPRAPVSDYLVE